jgi:hypothetical protein
MNKHPLLTAVCIYALGITFSGFFSLMLLTIFIISFSICIISLIRSKDRLYFLGSLFLFLFILGFSLSHLIFIKSTAPITPFLDKDIHFEGEIISQPDIRETKTNYHIRIKKLYSEKGSAVPDAKALISVYSTSPLSDTFKYGDIITGTGKIALPLPAKNLGSAAESSLPTALEKLVRRGGPDRSAQARHDHFTGSTRYAGPAYRRRRCLRERAALRQNVEARRPGTTRAAQINRMFMLTEALARTRLILAKRTQDQKYPLKHGLAYH